MELLYTGPSNLSRSRALDHDHDYILGQTKGIVRDHSAFFSDCCRPCPSPESQEVLTVAAPPVDLASNLAGPVCCVGGGGLVSRLARTSLWGSKDTDGSRVTNTGRRAA